MSVFFNEIHYDNSGTDSGEAIEIAGTAGTDLTGWQIVLYNGSNGQAYDTRTLSGVIADQDHGFGALSFSYPANGIQNGPPDAFALVDPEGHVVQFLSYEGVFTATNGPANGLTSTDIGVSEPGDVPAGQSLQLKGTGTDYADFTWTSESTASFGTINAGESFGGGSTPVEGAGTISIGAATVAEGDSGTQNLEFTVTRTGGTDAVTLDWAIDFSGQLHAASADDLAAGQALTGTVSFAEGQNTATITIGVAGDTAIENDETFGLSLSNPSTTATIQGSPATGTITNDDHAAPSGPANVFINEIHYDNSGTDVGEAIEIAGAAGTDLSGYSLVLYNGSNTPGAAPVYDTVALSGVIDDEGAGYGALSFSFPANGIQNGAQDGIALVGPDGHVVQLLSYEGTFTAAPGTPAAGMTSTDIGVSEDGGAAAGFSLQLKGAGSTAADFTWTSSSAASFGSLNDGQTIIADNGVGQIRIDNASVVEGNSGTSDLVFTVHRAGGIDSAASVDYTVNLDGGADASDFTADTAFNGTVTFAEGQRTATITLHVNGDTASELNESLSVALGNVQGNAAITGGTATGTIVNDDALTLAIHDIQGASHNSAYVGQEVTTNGIVTGVDTNGYYIEAPDAQWDSNAATSEGIFVFTGGAPTVAVGDAVSVTGTVQEYVADTGNLPVTELTNSQVTVHSSGNELPTAVVIGADGLLPPNANYDDDGLTSFDPQHDALDFYESLEGMRVTIEKPLVVSSTNDFGETYVVASDGDGATGVNSRDGITISNGDYNPERIQIDDDSGLFSGYTADHTQGDHLSDVTGIVNYSFASYEVLVTAPVTTESAGSLARETTSLVGDADHLSMATYNVENLDASDNKFDVLASDIVYNLKAPDIISLQEIQDADGAGSGSNLSGAPTAQGLIDAIAALGGPHYVYVEIAPTTPNSTGGEPNGNIRNGFLYNADRVSYVDGSAELITGSAFNNSRNPLVATFDFQGHQVTAIDVHATSRGGSDELEGSNQPPQNAGDGARTAQAETIKAYVDAHLATNPDLNLAVLGDFNGYYFEDALQALQGDGKLVNLNTLLPQDERYSYVFEGNSQQFDNILVTQGLANGAQYDSVHINSEFSADTRPTDHDPQVALFYLPSAITGTNGGETLNGTTGNDTIRGLGGDDSIFGGAGDDLIDGGAGNDQLHGGAGSDVFLFDNRSSTGNDRIFDFGASDLLDTTVKIFDSNNDGLITFGGDRKLALFADGSDVSIMNDAGKVVTKLYLEGTYVQDGQTHYVYGLGGADAHQAYIDHFATTPLI